MDINNTKYTEYTEQTGQTGQTENGAPADTVGACDIVSLIALTHSRMIRPFERSFANKFTGLEIIILCMLLEYGPCSISDIAAQLCLSKQQIAKLIAKLNLRGCVKRSHPSEDHRVVLVELTEETADMMRARRGDFYERLTKRIEETGGAENVKRFNDAVREMSSVLSALPDARRNQPTSNSE